MANIETKAFNVRMNKNVWKFLKVRSMDEDRSMNEIILDCIRMYKHNLKQIKLTSSDTMA